MQITRYIVGPTAIAIMLLGAPSALADSDRNEGVEANPELSGAQLSLRIRLRKDNQRT